MQSFIQSYIAKSTTASYELLIDPVTYALIATTLFFFTSTGCLGTAISARYLYAIRHDDDILDEYYDQFYDWKHKVYPFLPEPLYSIFGWIMTNL
jgi:hypothetical protein